MESVESRDGFAMAKERKKKPNESQIPGLGNLEAVTNRLDRLNLPRMFISIEWFNYIA